MEISDPSSFFCTIIILGGSVSLYYVYYYAKSRLYKYLMNRMMEELNKKQESEDILFQPLERTKSAVILYKHGGKEHKVCVPYDRSKSRIMLRKEVYLVRNGGEKEERIEITHKPGVPYLLSAKEMGGSKIIVIKDNKIIKEYGEDEKPAYLI